MTGRLLPDASRRRLDQSGDWQILRSAPGMHEGPPPDTEAWTAVPALGTAAACERALGRWSLDRDDGLSFDAFDWWFRTRFDLDALDDVVLGLDGLATVGQVWLNGTLVLSSPSMYLAHALPVTPHVRAAGNELVICSRALEPLLGQRRPRPAWRVPMLPQQQLRWFRTTLLGRAPGWTPPAAPAGPWRDVWIDSGARLRADAPALDVQLQPDGQGRVTLALSLAAPQPLEAVDLVLSRAGREWRAAMVPAADAPGRWRGELRVASPDLWWPHTHGEPALHALAVQVRQAGEVTRLDLGRVGFRRIELDTADGGLTLRVNGELVFCRGACWTPLDAVSLRASPQALDAAVAQVRAAGMNMLRVGGTMVYEEDAFHDACDAHGVLVWQDLMFANMDYPATDDAWRAQATQEVAQQLSRWQGRPSMAVVCGNSEQSQQAAMWGADRAQWAPGFFVDELAACVAQALPGVPYWPSSAWGGAFPHQVNQGTTSYYGVGAYLRPLDDARTSGLRFATEALAFANVPTAATLERMPGGSGVRVTHGVWKTRSSRDLQAGWDFDDVRDHYLQRLFGVDPSRLRYEDHERYLALSRVASGEAMAAAFSQWRAEGSVCQGALVWFLRDLWAGAGWGLLDDQGLPKPCWHLLRRVLQPQVVLLTDEGNSGLRAHVINERAEPLTARLGLEVWAGDTCRERVLHPLSVPARGRVALDVAALLPRFVDLTHAFRFGPLAHDVTAVWLEDAQGRRLSQALHLPAGLGMPRDPALGLEAVARPADDGTVVVAVSARRLALAVHVTAPGFEAEDAYVHLLPGQTHELRLRPQGRPRPWHGVVDALNASAPVSIRSAP